MSLTARESRLARLFTCVVLGEWDALRAQRLAAPAGEPDRAWREAVLQAHVFAGCPRVVEAYGVLASCGGLGEIGPEEALAEPDQPERGRALFERIDAKEDRRIRDIKRAVEPDFERFKQGYAYERILS